MDPQIKKLILYLSGTEGFLQDNPFVGYNIGREIRELTRIIKKLSQKISQSFNDNDCERLINEIKAGKLHMEVVSDVDIAINKKRLGCKSIKVNQDIIRDLGELAVWKVCEDCDYKRKYCKLKTTYKKLGEFGLYAPCQIDEIEKERNGEL